MAGADPTPAVAVEVLVEQDLIAPARVVLELLLVAQDRAPAALVQQEDADQPLGELGGDLVQGQESTGAGRALGISPTIERIVIGIDRPLLACRTS